MFGSDLLIGKRIPVLTICCSAFAKKELFSGLRGWNLSVRKIISTRHGKVHRYG